MSGSSPRRTHLHSASSRHSRPQHPSPRRPTPPPHRRRHDNKLTLKTTWNAMKRCDSAPIIRRGSDGDDQRRISSDGLWPDVDGSGGLLYRPHTCIDVFASSPSLMHWFSPHRISPGYNREAKVVVNVTVEGSPGALKAMVKLGSSVEDTIKVVIKKYKEEGRTPKLEKDQNSSYQLLHSYFSLQSLEKSELIGDVGSRSFYLRKSRVNGSSASRSEMIPARMKLAPPIPPPPFLLPPFVDRKISKIVRRTRRLWKVLVCWK